MFFAMSMISGASFSGVAALLVYVLEYEQRVEIMWIVSVCEVFLIGFVLACWMQTDVESPWWKAVLVSPSESSSSTPAMT